MSGTSSRRSHFPSDSIPTMRPVAPPQVTLGGASSEAGVRAGFSASPRALFGPSLPPTSLSPAPPSPALAMAATTSSAHQPPELLLNADANDTCSVPTPQRIGGADAAAAAAAAAASAASPAVPPQQATTKALSQSQSQPPPPPQTQLYAYPPSPPAPPQSSLSQTHSPP